MISLFHADLITDLQIARPFFIKVVQFEQIFEFDVELLGDLPWVVTALDRVILISLAGAGGALITGAAATG